MKRFVITLPKREHLMIQEMDRFYKGEYEIFEAITNKVGSVGISESFKKIISDNYNEEAIHILEDDVKFICESSRRYFEEQYNNLPDDWQIYLGGSYSHIQENELSEGLLKIRDYRTFNSVVIKKSAYDSFLSHDPNKVKNIDTWVSQKIKHAYLCWPMVAIERGGYSYNQNKIVDYSYYLKGKKLLHD